MADITPDMCSIMSVFKEQSDGALTSCLEGCVWRANTSNEPSGTGTFLEVGQFDQQPVCAHIRLQSAKDKPYLGANLVSLVAITIANGVETAAPLKTASAYQVEYLSPFKHVRSRVQDVDGDCPLKALMLAQVGEGLADKGKGKPPAASKNSRSLPNAITPELRRGHLVEEIERELLEKFKLKSLPYLAQLKWMPTTVAGSAERLQLGTRHHQPVFTYFNPRAPLPNQMQIVQGDGVREKVPIFKNLMGSVAFFEPYAFLDIEDDNPALAQTFRTFLKGLFALRGHYAGQLVSLYLKGLIRTVGVIQRKGFGSGNREKSSGSGGEDQAGHSSRAVDTIEVAVPRDPSSLASGKRGFTAFLSNYAPTPATSSSKDSSPSITTPTYYTPLLRSISAETRQASEDNTLNLSTHGKERHGFQTVNTPTAPLYTGRLGMFSAAAEPPKLASNIILRRDTWFRQPSDTGRSSGVTSTAVVGSVEAPAVGRPSVRVSPSSSPSPITGFTSLMNTPSSSNESPDPSRLDGKVSESSTLAPGHHQNVSMIEDLGGASDSSLPERVAIDARMRAAIGGAAYDTRAQILSGWMKSDASHEAAQKRTEDHRARLNALNAELTLMQRQVTDARASIKEQEKQVSATYRQAISSSVIPHQDGQDSAAYIESLTLALAELAELGKKAQADLAEFKRLGQEAIRQCEERIRSADAEKWAAEDALRNAAAEMEGAKKRKAEIEAESGVALGFALCEKYGRAGGGKRRRMD